MHGSSTSLLLRLIRPNETKVNMALHPQGDQSLITNVLAPSGVGTRKNLLELSRERRLKYSVYFFLAWLCKCPRFAARWASNMVSAIFGPRFRGHGHCYFLSQPWNPLVSILSHGTSNGSRRHKYLTYSCCGHRLHKLPLRFRHCGGVLARV